MAPGGVARPGRVDVSGGGTPFTGPGGGAPPAVHFSTLATPIMAPLTRVHVAGPEGERSTPAVATTTATTDQEIRPAHGLPLLLVSLPKRLTCNIELVVRCPELCQP